MIQQTDIDDYTITLDALGLKVYPGIERNEAQLLSTIIRNQLKEYNDDIYWYKSGIKCMYEESIPDNPDTLPYFKNLNMSKDLLRNTRRRMAKLVEIQRKLRKLSK